MRIEATYRIEGWGFVPASQDETYQRLKTSHQHPRPAKVNPKKQK